MSKTRQYQRPQYDRPDYGRSGSRGFDIGQLMDGDQEFSLSQKERENHTHIIGSTGTGKSKFLELLLRQDIKNRKAGLCLIDPHGSLYEEVLLYASHRYSSFADRFVFFNPAGETDNIVGFNPVHPDTDQMDYLLDSLISACLKAWGQDDSDRTPRITKWLENIFHTIISNDLTLVESAPLISIHNKEQRNILLRNVHSDLVLDDWRMFETSSNTQKQALIEGAANRLRKFLRNEHIRNIVGQKERVLNFSDAMADGKIVLINLNGQGKISQENMRLLGVLVVNEIFRCAKLRDARDPKLKPFYFYIDEFAQFVTRDIARTLEEARKFKLFMVLAHQHLAQLKKEDEYLYASVLTNCRNKVVFGGLSREDAEIVSGDISAGFLDQMAVKDEIYGTKARQNLEKRTTKNWSEGNSENDSYSETDGISESDTEGSSLGKTVGQSIGETIGKVISKTQAKTKGKSRAKNTSFQQSEGENVNNTTNQGIGYRSEPDFASRFARAVTGTAQDPSSFHEGQAQSRGEFRQAGRSDGQTDAEQESDTDTKGESESRSKNTTKMESQTQTNTKSHTTGKSQSQSRGRSVGKNSSVGESETWVNVAEEYEELSSRTFWSLQELEYMQMADIKNQGVAEAYIKTGQESPKRVKIKHVEDVFYHRKTSDRRMEKFKAKAIAENSECYTAIDNVYLERQERQIAAFGEELKFDAMIVEGQMIEDQQDIEDSNDPFT